MSPFKDWAAQRRDQVEAAIDRSVVLRTGLLEHLSEAMRYAVLGGGKRVRALLVYAAGELVGADDAALDAAASAVELVHGYSLVHDDLPCMDNDVLRRGKPTCHVKFGYAQAMLAGDALQPEAFRILSQMTLPAAARIALVEELAVASGIEGMCGGQMIDLESVGKHIDFATLKAMHLGKTGALIRAAILMGATCTPAGRPTGALLAALEGYARSLGLAFQIVDDILDATEDTAQLGKTAGKDALEDKPTYVSILGLEGARSAAQKSLDEALAALAQVPGDKSTTAHLEDLARYIVTRQS